MDFQGVVVVVVRSGHAEAEEVVAEVEEMWELRLQVQLLPPLLRRPLRLLDLQLRSNEVVWSEYHNDRIHDGLHEMPENAHTQVAE